MISDFPNSYHCQSRVHCQTCLTNADWRKNVSAPDTCPWGVTLENHAEKLREAQSRAAAPPPPPNPPSLKQPGDLLAFVIHEVTEEFMCGGCDQRRKLMNGWGWMGCMQNVSTIYGWLKVECEKRKLDVKKLKILEALVKAIRTGRESETANPVDNTPAQG